MLILFGLFLNTAFAQNPDKNVPNKTDDDVLRVSSDLIQIGVAVFDKDGRFVPGVKRDDFELKVDGKAATITFFQTAAAAENAFSKEKVSENKTGDVEISPVQRGRTIIFVVDDLHLSLESYKRTRSLIAKFIDEKMMPGDTAAIASTTGQIGFLQQFTDNKKVLRAALERLKFKSENLAADRLSPPMSEYEAQLIERGDKQIIDSFAEYLIKDNPPNAKTEQILDEARDQVRSRAQDIITRSAGVSKGTFSALEQVVRRSAILADRRKILFFISDGFLINSVNNDAVYRLQRVTDAAARTNTVIYTFDAKGLDLGLPDTTTETPRNPLSTKELSASYRVKAGADFEAQDGLNRLAEDTGGRFVHNINDFQKDLNNALDEASLYYLLAWQPDDLESGKSDKLKKIEVSVRNRPELKVRMQGGYLDRLIPEKSDKNKKDEKKSADKKSEQQNTAPDDLPTPANGAALPVWVGIGYSDKAAEGSSLSLALKIKSRAVTFTPEPGSEDSVAKLELVGTVYNTEGKKETEFGTVLSANARTASLSDASADVPDIYYDRQIKVKPGLYLMRLTILDRKSGRRANANQWIEIPDISSRKPALGSFALSEIKAGDKNADAVESADADTPAENQNLERRFSRSSALRYQTFIYNAAQNNLTLHFQILHGKKVLLEGSTAISPPKAGQDSSRLPYAADIPLNTLAPGYYELRAAITDPTAKNSAEQSINFEVIQ